MSLTYTVTFDDDPAELESKVLQILDAYGYSCQFQPGTRLLSQSTEGFCLAVRAYPSPKARVRPDRTFLVCIGLNFAPDENFGKLRQLQFVTSSGRTRLERQLQILVAAAIAQITGGDFSDPQAGVQLDGQGALRYAHEECQRGTPAHDLRELEFLGW